MTTTGQQADGSRLQRARYLLAMGITPWVPRGMAAPAAELAERAPNAAPKPESQPQTSHVRYRLAVKLELSDEAQFSWTEPPGRLLRSMLAAVDIDPRLVLLTDGQDASPQVPLWQFGGERAEPAALVLPTLEAMLATPALKARAWQILSDQERK